MLGKELLAQIRTDHSDFTQPLDPTNGYYLVKIKMSSRAYHNQETFFAVFNDNCDDSNAENLLLSNVNPNHYYASIHVLGTINASNRMFEPLQNNNSAIGVLTTSGELDNKQIYVRDFAFLTKHIAHVEIVIHLY